MFSIRLFSKLTTTLLVVTLMVAADGLSATPRVNQTSPRGLASVQLPPQVTLIAFATAPGDVAEDGEGKRNYPQKMIKLMWSNELYFSHRKV